MKLTDISTYLYNFLSGDLKADTERMLDGLGYVAKALVEAPDLEAVKAEAKQAGFEEGKAAGIEEGKKTVEDSGKAATERALEILSLCDVAGMQGKAAEYIGGEKSKEAIQQELTDAKALEASENNVTSTVDPLSTGDHNPVLADAQRRADAAKRP